MDTKVTTPVVKGIIISLAIIVFNLALYFTGNAMNQGLGYLQYLILAIGLIWGCVNYANQMNNNVSFGNVFAHGFKTTAVATVLVILYSVISIKLLFPEMTDEILEKAQEEMAKQKMTDDQAETAINMTRKFLVPFMIAGILFFFLLDGVIASLIGAGIAKKNPQDPFHNPVNPS